MYVFIFCLAIINQIYLQVHVAVKSLQVTDSREIAQMHSDLVMEANAMIALNHPNLIRLYGVILTSPMMLVSHWILHRPKDLSNQFWCSVGGTKKSIFLLSFQTQSS